jgi:hypothetical protein
LNDDEILAQRRLARMEKSQADERLTALHRQAANALQDVQHGERVREQALARVAKWDSDQLCNPRYVNTWRAMLNLPVAALCAAMLRQDAEGVSLRQNSPFGFLLHEAAR